MKRKKCPCSFKITRIGFQTNTLWTETIKQGLPVPYKIRSFKNINKYTVVS